MLEVGIGYYLPDAVKPRDVFAGRSAADVKAFVAADCAEPARCLGAEPRLWVVVPFANDQPLDLFPPAEQALLKQYSTVLVRHPSGMTIALIQRAG
jgi:mannosyltransferase